MTYRTIVKVVDKIAQQKPEAADSYLGLVTDPK
jgi:hypothetical protein